MLFNMENYWTGETHYNTRLEIFEQMGGEILMFLAAGTIRQQCVKEKMPNVHVGVDRIASASNAEIGSTILQLYRKGLGRQIII